MKIIEYLIKDPSGIHARPATQIAFYAMNCPDKIQIVYGDQIIDGDNVIEVMNLRAQYGDKITFRIEGDQEEATLEGLLQVMESLEQ